MKNENPEIQPQEQDLQSIRDDNQRALKYVRRSNYREFSFATYVEESHGQKIYAVEFFNHPKVGEPIIFATCGSNQVTIYECKENCEIKLLQYYAAPTQNELFYTCCWSFDPTTLKPILAAAGLCKIIRIIDPMTMISSKDFIGHEESINKLKFHPKIPVVLMSVSNDHSVRLWNIETEVCIAVFVGVEMLSADFDATGSRIATSGMDKTVKIWHLNKPSIQEAIQASLSYDRNESPTFTTVFENVPEQSFDNIHKKYVDCVEWMGNLIFSKSNENSVVCWSSGRLGDDNTAKPLIIRKFKYVGGANCSLRFSTDYRKTYMAVGNDRGTTLVWKINGDESDRAIHLKHCLCTAAVCDTAFSRDSKILISVCDDATIYEVLSADFDAAGHRIMSCGMDHSLKLWRLDKSPMKEAIKTSFTFNPNKSVRPFSTVLEHFPDFSTRDVHRNYVKWLGNFVLSKSCENSIICWKPGRLGDTSVSDTSSISVIHRFEYKACEIWFNQNGKTLLWELGTQDPTNAKCSTLQHIKCTTAIRQTAFSRDGDILICVCDDGTVWRWDRVN